MQYDRRFVAAKLREPIPARVVSFRWLVVLFVIALCFRVFF